jgi:hypothetical protein
MFRTALKILYYREYVSHCIKNTLLQGVCFARIKNYFITGSMFRTALKITLLQGVCFALH